MRVDLALPWLMGALGLVIGSFLGVCVSRIPRGQSIVSPGSACESCGSRLPWWDNIPVVSYLALGGRCRTCGARIPAACPLIEIVTGALFVGAALAFGAGWLLVSRLVRASILVALFLIDLEHRILPDSITLPGIVVGFLFSLLTEPGWLASLIGIVAGGGALLAIAEAYYRWRKEEGLGMGDVKMLGMLGAFLGWKLMLLTLVLSSFLGSITGLGMLVAGRGSMQSALPFGSFLAAAAVIAMFLGDGILDWYFGFYS
jgi:leader peptidase (prepilin peptidase)/N-methyltransferase